MFDFIGFLIFGFVVGVIAKMLTPGRDPQGCLITIALGIGGSLLGGYLGQLLHFYPRGHPAGWIASIIGAILLLVVFRAIRGK